MARFGKLPVKVLPGVTVTVSDGKVSVAGPKGTIERTLPRLIQVEVQDGNVSATTKNTSKQALSSQGTMRSHLFNMIKGVSEGFKKDLEIVGAGFRAEVRGTDLVMQIGYSHPVTIKAPEGISFKVEKSIVTVSGVNIEDVGQTAALVRAARVPEPYKGTGIKYTDEIIRRKAGKQAAK